MPRSPRKPGARFPTTSVLTTTEAAHVLGVSSARVRQLIADGRLAAARLGRDYLIEAADVRTLSLLLRRPGRPRKKTIARDK